MHAPHRRRAACKSTEAAHTVSTAVWHQRNMWALPARAGTAGRTSVNRILLINNWLGCLPASPGRRPTRAPSLHVARAWFSLV